MKIDIVPQLLSESQRLKLDRFGYLYARKQARAPEEKEFDLLRKEILGWNPLLPADKPELLEGFEYQVQVSEKAKVKHWVSMTSLNRAVGGFHKLMAIAVVSFKSVADLIGASEAEKLQGESQTGHRTLKAVALFSVPCERMPRAA